MKTEFLKSEITLNNLKPNTTYNILPYIVDKGGETAYLEIISFTTTKDTYSNPVIRSDAPDPTVIRATDGLFYLYHTSIGIYRSINLIDWKYLGKAFTDAGRPDWEPNGGLWAPDINYINGKYVMYYSTSVCGGEWTCGIGVATSDRPEGPFTDQGKLFRRNEIGVQNSIDPFYMEDNGKKYLFWGSFRGIYGIELSDDGFALKIGTEKQQIQDKEGNDCILYHAYEAANSSRRRQVLMDRINWEGDWPSVIDKVLSSKSETPVF